VHLHAEPSLCSAPPHGREMIAGPTNCATRWLESYI
jgi:hypothetical protein